MNETEQDALTIVIKWEGGEAEVTFYPDEDADFIAFFKSLTYQEQDALVKGALYMAMFRHRMAAFLAERKKAAGDADQETEDPDAAVWQKLGGLGV
jgi:hypothetical protein